MTCSSFLHPHFRRALGVTLKTSFPDVDEAASAAAAASHWKGAAAFAASVEDEIGAAAGAAGSTAAVDEAVAEPCGQNSDSPQADAAAVETASRSSRAAAAGRTAEGSSSHLD